MAHAKLSPSASKRWMNCAGSVRLIESLDLAEGRPSRAAAEGTVAHWVCEQALLQNKSAYDFVNVKMEQDGFTIKVTAEMADACQVYVDYVNNLEGEKHFEVACSLTHLGIEGLDGGTSDAIVIDDDKKILRVIDYKHGAGVYVHPENNPQLMQYGLGAAYEFDVPEDYFLELTIVQPRCSIGEPIETWAYTEKTEFYDEPLLVGDLKRWETENLKPKALATTEDDAPLIPGDEQCTFCPAMAHCVAHHEKVQELALLDFQDFAPNVKTISAEQKAKILLHKDMIIKFMDAVSDSVLEEIMNGSREYANNFKLVRKKTNRRLTDDAFDEDFSPLLDYLDVDELYSRKKKGIGEIEKLLIKQIGDIKEAKQLLELVLEKPEGSITVAPLDDKREEVFASAVDEFKHLTD